MKNVSIKTSVLQPKAVGTRRIQHQSLSMTIPHPEASQLSLSQQICPHLEVNLSPQLLLHPRRFNKQIVRLMNFGTLLQTPGLNLARMVLMITLKVSDHNTLIAFYYRIVQCSHWLCYYHFKAWDGLPATNKEFVFYDNPDKCCQEYWKEDCVQTNICPVAAPIPTNKPTDNAVNDSTGGDDGESHTELQNSCRLWHPVLDVAKPTW